MNNLADKIRRMAQYVDKENIAKVLGIPVEVVEGIISGELDDETLSSYDPSKPPEIKVVEQKKYIRSKTVGFLSIGGAGATSLAASCSLLIAQNNSQKIAAVDLNENSTLGFVLGIKGLDEPAVNCPSIFMNGIEHLEISRFEHPHLMNLDIYPGPSSVMLHNSVNENFFKEILKKIPERYNTVIFDCPNSPRLWPIVLPQMDLLFLVVPQDLTSLSKMVNIIRSFQQLHISDRTMIVFSNKYGSGGLAIAACRAVTNSLNASVIASLPYENRLHTITEPYILKFPNTQYAMAVQDIVKILLPEMNVSKPKGFFNNLSKIIGRE